GTGPVRRLAVRPHLAGVPVVGGADRTVADRPGPVVGRGGRGEPAPGAGVAADDRGAAVVQPGGVVAVGRGVLLPRPAAAAVGVRPAAGGRAVGAGEPGGRGVVGAVRAGP